MSDMSDGAFESLRLPDTTTGLSDGARPDYEDIIELHWNLVHAEAERLSLLLPDINIDDYLNTRLQRQDKALVVDIDEILGGVKEMEIENHSSVTIKGKAKGDDSPDFEITPAESIPERWLESKDDAVDLIIDATPSLEEHSEELANIGFWCAVLTSQIIGDDKMKKEKLDEIAENLRKKSSAQSLGSLATALTVITGRIGMMVGGYGIPIAPSLAITAGQIGTQVGLNILSRGNRNRANELAYADKAKIVDEIENTVLESAILLAKKYKPLRYIDAELVEEFHREKAIDATAHAKAKKELR